MILAAINVVTCFYTKCANNENSVLKNYGLSTNL